MSNFVELRRRMTMRRWIAPLIQGIFWIAVPFWTITALADGLAHSLFQQPRLLSGGDDLGLLALSLGFASFSLTRRKAIALLVLSASLAIDMVPWAFAILMVVALLYARYHQRHPSGPLTTLGRVVPWHVPIQLDLSDRYMHLHVIGPTGSGKSSSILMPLIEQDLRAKRAITLIEPKGDLSYTAYQAALRHHATVIYFDPHRADCAHYNPLSGPADVAAEGLSWALNQITEAGHPFYAVTSRVLLMYSVMAVKETLGEQADLTHVLDFLRMEAFREDILRQSHDLRVLAYFREQLKQIGARTAQEQRQGLLNRLELLLVNPDIRRVLTGSGHFNWDTVLRDEISVICPLSLARLGESAKVIGTLLWHGLAMATYRRLKAGTVPPYFLYLDEFHQYVTPDLSDYLALARGYSVGLVLAHQDMGQLSPPLQEALLANARQRMVLGGIHAHDAAIFSQLAAPYPLPPTLRYLPRGRAYAQLTKHGRLTRPLLLQLPHIPLSEEVLPHE
ncbi:MAG: conjugal transfer protein TraG [Sulfobacillus thermosulfidooxidans]|nr:MAG: conjugal transfer protein TraG [Sulfobacillus thermosulfidooxidans]